MFAEGTRVDEPDVLGSPHHGAGRLALESGASVVPTAIAGTSHLWLGPIPKPRRVLISFLDPVSVTGGEDAREALTDLIDRRVWPAVQEEYGRLAATPRGDRDGVDRHRSRRPGRPPPALGDAATPARDRRAPQDPLPQAPAPPDRSAPAPLTREIGGCPRPASVP